MYINKQIDIQGMPSKHQARKDTLMGGQIKHVNREIDTDRQIDRQIDGWIDRQIERKAHYVFTQNKRECQCVCVCVCVHRRTKPIFPPILSVSANRFLFLLVSLSVLSVCRVLLAGYGAGPYQRVLLKWIHSGRPGSR